jgi:hypothetical protein
MDCQCDVEQGRMCSAHEADFAAWLDELCDGRVSVDA